MDNQNTPMGWLVAKIASVWAAVGISSWNEAAGFMAFLYSAWLAWRDIVRPELVRRGLLQPMKPKVTGDE